MLVNLYCNDGMQLGDGTCCSQPAPPNPFQLSLLVSALLTALATGLYYASRWGRAAGSVFGLLTIGPSVHPSTLKQRRASPGLPTPTIPALLRGSVTRRGSLGRI